MSEFAFEQLVAPEPEPAAPEPAGDPVAEARAQAEAIRAAAHAEGRAAGEAAGRAAAEQRVAETVAALTAALEAVRGAREAAAEEVERAAVELALALAEKLVAGALEVEPERVLDAVRGALRGVVERERVTILVNPDDVELVRAAGGESLLAGCDVLPERRVGRGGALVRTQHGEVDATLDAKLERARTAVAEALAA